MRRFFILLWTGYFASVGIGETILGVLNKVAMKMGIYPSEGTLFLLGIGTALLGGLMMAYIFDSYRVFWSKGRIEYHWAVKNVKLLVSRTKEASSQPGR